MSGGRPGIRWWVSTTKYLIETALSNRPDISERLGIYRNSFISWCSKTHVGNEPDLDTYIEEFLPMIKRTRLEDIDTELLRQFRKVIFERDSYTCKYCQQIGGRLELDHAIPLSRGGLTTESNLVTACLRCNREKHNKTPAEYLAWRTANA